MKSKNSSFKKSVQGCALDIIAFVLAPVFKWAFDDLVDSYTGGIVPIERTNPKPVKPQSKYSE